MLLSSIRQQILDRAIRGQLVPQLPEEGTAEELYQQIQAEKKALIANGSIKKEKPLEPIQEEDIPFEIPATWKWVQLQDICMSLGAGLTPSKSNKAYHTNGTIPWILTGDLNDQEILEAPNKITQLALDNTSLQIKPSGSLLIAMYGATIGKLGILTFPACMNQACCCIEPHQNVNRLFLFYYLRAIRSSLKTSGEGSAQPNISKEKLRILHIPLPPQEEQTRIVRKIEALFSALDTVESSKKRISAIQTELTKRILEQAIQGKLVPQLPEEGTAEELYQQIQAEKQRLIAAGTIKKEKPLPPIEEKDHPFDIPETWKWVRLGDCGAFTRGSGIKKNEVVAEGKPCVRYGQLYTTYKTRFSQAVSHVPQELFDKCKQASKGDILMALTGENKVDIAMAVLYEGEEALAIGGDMTKFSPVRIDPLYLVYTLNSPYGISCKTERSTGDIIVHTSNDKLSTIPIPLPPLAEQKRIVAKIEEMLTLCKTLQ
ncbi:MAG: restriction endonuclease subunit S [Akkermansia sp.]|nr:restriction endonuclease subunit S [Akkermansia sp.]